MKWNRLTILVLAAAAAGCAVPTKVISTSSRTVAVQSFKGMQDAQNVANAECSKAGRTARWASGDGPTYIYDCVQ